MKKYFFILFVFLSIVVIAQPKFTELAVKPGAFSRIGFGARGIGLGNAVSSITEGQLVSYYNPAITPFQESNSFQAGYSFLSLDRSLNFLSFTRKFDFYSSKDTIAETRKPRTTAGLSIGVINSGVGKIDGRDNNGLPTGELSTSENQFFMGLAARVSEKLSLGVSVKFYYYKLYEEISSNSLGFDVGALYRVNENFNVSLVVADINSKYKWDTSPIYQQEGIVSEDKFPNLRKVGVSYRNKEIGILGAIEFENSNAETNILRAGVEYNIYDQFYIRAGLDQFNLSNTDWPIKPVLGFSYFQALSNFVVGVDYAFQIEQYSSSDRHIVSVNFNF
ncbi:MAG: hypothetical protein OQK52_02835 [Ignavibacteriaceae bacterium]|nr:hypothetical protein [Ignavibacteriaceae bacterium]MCW8816795.1 hypothetical protein [Ignavibacteriaceae bacterium]